MTDQDGIGPLLSRIGRGDRDALTTLVDRTAPALSAVTARILAGDSAAAAEALRRSYLLIWDLADEAAATGAGRGWLLRLARDQARTLRPGAAPQATAADLADLSDDPPDPPLPDTPLLRALALLDPPRAEAILGAARDGLSRADLALLYDLDPPRLDTWLDTGFDRIATAHPALRPATGGGALAARLALGLAADPDRQLASDRAATDPAFRLAVLAWQAEIEALLAALPPGPVPPDLHIAIAAALFPEDRTSLLTRSGLVPALIGGFLAAAIAAWAVHQGLLLGEGSPVTPPGPAADPP